MINFTDAEDGSLPPIPTTKFIPPEIIGERIKIREKQPIFQVRPWQYAVLRYDGHCFSKFTSGFAKPFDDNMKNAMQHTLMDVIDKFNPVVGYVQSDEITIVLKPLYQNIEEFEASQNKGYHIFGGKRDKLVSVISGYISARFNYHIINLLLPVADKYKKSFIDLVNSSQQHFDGRLLVYEANENIELLNYFVWRQNDCLRNCTSTYARHAYGHKHIMHKKFHDLVDMLNQTDVKHNDISYEYKYGVFAKKKLYNREGIDKKTKKPIEVTRSRVDAHSILVSAKPSFEYLLTEKYWK